MFSHSFPEMLIPSYLFAVLLPKSVHQLSPFISALLVYHPKMIITNDWWWPHDIFFKTLVPIPLFYTMQTPYDSHLQEKM